MTDDSPVMYGLRAVWKGNDEYDASDEQEGHTRGASGTGS